MGLEELDVEETFAHVERFQDLAARRLDRRADFGPADIAHVPVLVDDLHDALVVASAGSEDDLAVDVDQPVIGNHQPLDELLHHEGDVLRLLAEEVVEFGGIRYLVGVRCARAAVGLDHHRIADAADEGLRAGAVGAGALRDRLDAALAEEGAHARLLLQVFHEVELGAENVEVGADAGFEVEPVFIERLEAVDAPPFVDEMTDRAKDEVVFLHVGDKVIFRQRLLELWLQPVIGRVADAKHHGAGLFQPVAEFRAVGGKMRGEEDEVHGQPPDAALFLRLPVSVPHFPLSGKSSFPRYRFSRNTAFWPKKWCVIGGARFTTS